MSLFMKGGVNCYIHDTIIHILHLKAFEIYFTYCFTSLCDITLIKFGCASLTVTVHM